jgi:2-octaprenyl-6-methoxyphenol hydroxylase
MNKEINDISIVGAGLTGLAFCNLLKSKEISVSIIDVNSKKFYETTNNERYIVLSNTSQIILDSIGLWSEIKPHCINIKNIHVSKKNIFGSAVIKASDESLDYLGYQVSVKHLISILYKNIENQKNINFIYESKVTTIEQGEIIKINYTQASEIKNISSKSVIFSSGSTDYIINKIFKEKVEKNYKQNAVVCELTSSKYNSDTAYERFTGEGILGIIPRRENKWTLIYSTDKNESEKIKKLNKIEVREYFQSKIGKKCGTISNIDNVKMYPLKMRYYKKFIKDNICLLGDAAHTLHPIAAQSFNLSLRDSVYLTRIIEKIGIINADSYNKIFHSYLKEREQEIDRIIKFTDYMATLIHGNSLLKNKIIGASLLLIDINKNIRINIIRYLLGINFSDSLITTIKKEYES